MLKERLKQCNSYLLSKENKYHLFIFNYKVRVRGPHWKRHKLSCDMHAAGPKTTPQGSKMAVEVDVRRWSFSDFLIDHPGGHLTGGKLWPEPVDKIQCTTRLYVLMTDPFHELCFQSNPFINIVVCYTLTLVIKLKTELTS